MAVTKQPLRYGHCEGHTDLCYDETGKYLLTSGAEGEVRVWEGVDDDDAQTHKVGDKVYTLASKNGHFYTASDSNTVQVHTFPDGSPDGLVTRFTAPVTHMCFNESGSHLLAGSSDFSVKLVEVETSNYKVFQGHEAPILSVAMDTEMEYISTASCDGTVRIWNIGDQTCVKTLNLIPKCNDISASKTLCRISWHPKNGNLVIPVNKEIQVYDRNTWTLSYVLTDASVQEVISIVSFSPCGRYLACSCLDGLVLVFDHNLGVCIERSSHEKKLTVTALAWNPRNNRELAYCDNQGMFRVLQNVVPDGSNTDAATSEQPLASNQYTALFDDDDDDDMLMQVTNHSRAQINDDESSDDDDIPRLSKIKAQYQIDDAVDNDSHHPDEIESVIEPVQPVYVPTGPKTTTLQKPFKSSSTPVHLSSRFMVWNSVGIIKQYNTEDEKSIDIEFHDTSTHHAMHLDNPHDYTMADLSSQAAILACEGDGENPSRLHCHHFGSWDNTKEWSITMPKGEDIQAIAIGDGWMAAATDKRNVRLLSVGGLQLELFSVPGPIVTLAGYSHNLLVVYHAGTGTPGDQCLGVKVLEVIDRKKNIINGEMLPLSPKSTLSWAGFSAEGTPFTMDSSGIIRMLNRKLGPTWIQVASMKDHCKGKSDNYWIVGINEFPEQIRCVLCKGSTYPPTLPRPVVGILPFKLPLCEMETEKTQLEELYWRSCVMTGHFDMWHSQGLEFEEKDKDEASKPMTEALMKAFALSCKCEREYRALELCEMMPNQHTVQLAIKYASRLKRIQLAQMISDVARQKAEEEILKLQNEMTEDEEGNIGAPVQPRCDPEVSSPVVLTPRQQDEQTNDNVMEEEEEIKERAPFLSFKSKQKPLKTVLPSSGSRKNPFKVGGSCDSSQPAPIRGSSVFDDMTRKSSRTAKNPAGPNESEPKKKTQMQMKLFPEKSVATPKTTASKNGDLQDTETEVKEPKMKRTAFDLWKEDNLERLQEEHPDVDAEEINVLAVQKFAELPKDQKRNLLDKAKGIQTNANEEAESKKRKWDDGDENAGSQVDLFDDAQVTKSQDRNHSYLAKKKRLLSQTTNSKLAAFKKD